MPLSSREFESLLQQVQASLLGRVNLRPRSITEDKLAEGAASAAIVRDGVISDVHIGTLTLDALTVLGTMQSSNYSAGVAGWHINANGVAEFNEVTVIGAISGGTIDIGGADTTSFHVDATGQMWLGHASFASAPFRVTAGGAVTATGVTVTGTINNEGGTGDIGTNALQWDATGRMWLGAATFAAAPFSVAANGDLIASNAVIEGTIATGTSGRYIAVGSSGLGIEFVEFFTGHADELRPGEMISSAYDLDASREALVMASPQLNSALDDRSSLTLTSDDPSGGGSAVATAHLEGENIIIQSHATASTSAIAFSAAKHITCTLANSGVFTIGQSGYTGNVLIQGSTDGILKMRDTSTAGAITSYTRFEDSGGALDARVGMVAGDLVVWNQFTGGDINFYTENALEWVISAFGTLRPNVDQGNDIGTGTIAVDDIWAQMTNSTTNAQAMNRNSSDFRLQYDGSSRRWKKQIEDWAPAGGFLPALQGLRPRSYLYGDDENPNVGMVTEELEPFLPEVISARDEAPVDENGVALREGHRNLGMKGDGGPIAYSPNMMITFLVGVCKELETKVAALEAA